jgi:hypothetical protein
MAEPGGAMTTHNPVTPAWTCGGCGAEWPCLTRRRELHAEFAGATVSLAIYLGSYFAAAAPDLRYAPAGLLHQRFVGWVWEGRVREHERQQPGGPKFPRRSI